MATKKQEKAKAKAKAGLPTRALRLPRMTVRAAGRLNMSGFSAVFAATTRGDRSMQYDFWCRLIYIDGEGESLVK
jgi:hypothetical protein